jgi:hypothetical protein
MVWSKVKKPQVNAENSQQREEQVKVQIIEKDRKKNENFSKEMTILRSQCKMLEILFDEENK